MYFELRHTYGLLVHSVVLESAHGARMLVVATTERLGDSNVPRLPANHATGLRAKPLLRLEAVEFK